MTLAQDLRKWMERLSEPRAEFNGLSACPHAKQARVTCIEVADTEEARHYLRCLEPQSPLVIDIPMGMAPMAHALVKELNPDLRERGLFAFVSDPDAPVIVKGYQTTQSDRLFIIMQPYDELQKASEQLEKKGYYQHWDEETLRRVKGGR